MYGLQPSVIAPATTSIAINAAAMAVSFVAFIALGTALFVRAERNR